LDVADGHDAEWVTDNKEYLMGLCLSNMQRLCALDREHYLGFNVRHFR